MSHFDVNKFGDSRNLRSTLHKFHDVEADMGESDELSEDAESDLYTAKNMSVDKNSVTKMLLQGLAQEKFEEVYGDSELFIRIFDKDYLWRHCQKNGLTYSKDYDIPEVFNEFRENFEALNVKSPNENIHYTIDTD